MHVLLTLANRNERAIDQATPDEARTNFRSGSRLVDVCGPPMHRVQELATAPERGAPPIPMRLYAPSASQQPQATVVYIHGGGFALGDLDSHDGLCRLIAERANAILIALDYRRSPEHPFPCAVDDVRAAYDWIVTNAERLGIDPARIAVAGDSAGGNLAAVLCLTRRDAGLSLPIFQLLIYPATDMTRSFESHRLFPEGFMLTKRALDTYLAYYLQTEAQQTDPLASPLFAEDLRGLPPAHIVTAGFDPLRDEGIRYAERLRESSVAASDRCYDSLIHGFAQMGGVVDAARFALDDAIETLRFALQRQSVIR